MRIPVAVLLAAARCGDAGRPAGAAAAGRRPQEPPPPSPSASRSTTSKSTPSSPTRRAMPSPTSRIDDFEVLEDGKPQKITAFSLSTFRSSAPSARSSPRADRAGRADEHRRRGPHLPDRARRSAHRPSRTRRASRRRCGSSSSENFGTNDLAAVVFTSGAAGRHRTSPTTGACCSRRSIASRAEPAARGARDRRGARQPAAGRLPLGAAGSARPTPRTCRASRAIRSNRSAPTTRGRR